MSDTKRVLLKFISPRGIYRYPRLLKPDAGPKGKESKVPKFSVKNEFDPGQQFVVGKTKVSQEEIVEKLEALRDAKFDEVEADLKAKKKGAALKKLSKAPVLRPVLDEDGNETGKLFITAKTASEYKDKKTGEIVKKRPPTMFDAKGKELKKLPNVGGGSEGKLSVSADAYYVDSSGEVGVTYYLEATQLLKLVEFGGRSAADHGFGEEEGYSGDEDGPAEFDDESASKGEESTAKAGDDF